MRRKVVSSPIAMIMAVVCLVRPTLSTLSCRAENGQPVDWFVLYKLPESSSRGGDGYVYRTSIDVVETGSSSSGSGGTWIPSNRSIGASSSLPGQTLDPIYSTRADRLLLMYNDEFPNGTSSETAAHAKGVLAFDGLSGFWLVHSVPRYPPSPDQGNYSFPATGMRYGQTMLCLTLPFSQADVIGEQLRFYHPFVYHWSPPSAATRWIDAVPNLVAVAGGDHVTRPPWFRSLTLFSSNQLAVTSFAKARQYGLDLYGDWMAAALSSNLYVETWTNGQGRPMPSLCKNSTYTVLNVKQVRLDSGQVFSSHNDHSKWAVSSRPDDPWVCIADINRMESQRNRGGGSLCFRHAALWRHLALAVDQVEGCPLSSDPYKKRKLTKIGMKKEKLRMLNDVTRSTDDGR